MNRTFRVLGDGFGGNWIADEFGQDVSDELVTRENDEGEMVTMSRLAWWAHDCEVGA